MTKKVRFTKKVRLAPRNAQQVSQSFPKRETQYYRGLQKKSLHLILRPFADPVSSTTRKAHAPSPNRRLIPWNQRLKTPPKDDIAMKKTTKDTTDNSTESTRESDLDPSPHLSSLRLLNALKKKSCRLRQKGRSAPQILSGKIPKTHQSTVWMT